MNDDWYGSKGMKEYEADGRGDADKGEVNMPYPTGLDDPMEDDANEAYRRGFFARRKELGSKFKWAGDV